MKSRFFTPMIALIALAMFFASCGSPRMITSRYPYPGSSYPYPQGYPYPGNYPYYGKSGYPNNYPSGRGRREYGRSRRNDHDRDDRNYRNDGNYKNNGGRNTNHD